MNKKFIDYFKDFGIALGYAIIMASLIITLILLIDILIYGSSKWVEPNTNLLILEILLIIYGILFTWVMVLLYFGGGKIVIPTPTKTGS